MTVIAISVTNAVLGAAGVVALAVYLGFIVAPACASYSRKWEKVAAAFLTLFILLGLLVTGAAIGGALVWSYDRWG
jgi:small-conductance mechanosensitive channel